MNSAANFIFRLHEIWVAHLLNFMQASLNKYAAEFRQTVKQLKNESRTPFFAGSLTFYVNLRLFS